MNTAALSLERTAAGAAQPLFSCKTPVGLAKIYDSIEAIKPALWDALFPAHWKNHAYYRTLADTLSGEFPQRFLVLENAAGRTLAIQPFFVVAQDLTVSLPTVFRRLVAAVRAAGLRRFLTTRLLMVGCVVGHGQTGLAAALTLAEKTEVFVALDAALARYARCERIGIRIWKEFPAETRRDLAAALRQRRGHVRIPSLPGVHLSLRGLHGFDDFLETRLGKATRKSLRRKFRESAAATAARPLTLEVKNHVTAAEATELHALYERVARRGEVRFEIFPRDYFLLLGQRMPERAHFFTWRHEGRVVAFAFCMVHGDTIYDNDIGLDYAVAHDLHLYHVTFRDLVNWATARGLRAYQSSPFNYEPKLRLRMELAPLDLYIRHRSRLVQGILRIVAPWVEPTRQERWLRGFSNFPALHAD